MKKLANVIYYIKTLLFVVHFYFIFVMLPSILDTKVFGYIFLIFYFVYIIKTILELLSQKKRYKNDWIYNSMQIGFIAYIVFITLKISINKMYVTNITYSYFRNNFIIMSVLIIFILIYSFIELDNKKIWKN